MYVKEMESPKHAMVFGHIEAGKGPMYFSWVQLRHTDAAGNEEYYTTRSNEDGMFYAENLPLGKYEIHRIGQGNRPMGSNVISGGGVVWSLGEGSKDTAMRVKTAGVHYLGSFKYIYIEGEGLFGRDSFNFKRINSPSEKELLQRLLKYTENTHWSGSINKRLAELR
jgi:hypothetical protein